MKEENIEPFELTDYQKKQLFELTDDGTTYVTIATPDDWKCDRENCKIDWKHTHSTFSSLSTSK